MQTLLATFQQCSNIKNPPSSALLLLLRFSVAFFAFFIWYRQKNPRNSALHNLSFENLQGNE